MKRPCLAVTLTTTFVVRAGAFGRGPLPEPSSICVVTDERRRDFLGAMLATTAITPMRADATNSKQSMPQSLGSIHDDRLRGYRTPSLPHWEGTALSGPLSLSDAYEQINRGTSSQRPALDMGRWPDPILRHRASPIPTSFFRDDSQLEKLRLVADALKNTARDEGAVGLAAQQCGVDASLVFIDSVVDDASTKGPGGAFGRNGRRREIAGEGKMNGSGRDGKDEGIFLVNPRIVHRSPESEMLVWTEQCLVLPPEFRATLLRDAQVTIEYESLAISDASSEARGSTRQITLRGELARCAQHEMDHDRGVLIVDHVPTDELLDGMAGVENADGLHKTRMQVAYSREVSDSSLLPANERMVSLAMERSEGYHAKVKQIKGGYVYEERKRLGFVQSANAAEQTAMPSAAPPESPDQPKNASSSDCDEKCLEERRRRVEERRAMMQQSRSNTRRSDVLELSKQRATLYGAEYKGLPPQACSQGFCP